MGCTSVQFLLAPVSLEGHRALCRALSRMGVPPKPLSDMLAALATAAHAKVDLAESRTLGQLRDAILPTLLSGELRVPTPAKPKEVHV